MKEPRLYSTRLLLTTMCSALKRQIAMSLYGHVLCGSVWVIHVHVCEHLRLFLAPLAHSGSDGCGDTQGDDTQGHVTQWARKGCDSDGRSVMLLTGVSYVMCMVNDACFVASIPNLNYY